MQDQQNNISLQTQPKQTGRQKLATVLGAAIYMMFCGTVYIMGSISPYLASYFSVPLGKTQLLLPSLICLQTITMPFGAQLAERVSSRCLILIGSSIAIACTLIAAEVPRTQFKLFAVFFVGGFGLCMGLTYTVPIRLGFKAFPDSSAGLISGLIIAGFGLGSLVFTYLATMIVNPDNLNQVTTLDAEGNEVMAFPESVASQVPTLLRWLALSWSCLIVTALLLISEVPKSIVEPTKSDDMKEEAIKDDDFVSANDCVADRSRFEEDLFDLNEQSFFSTDSAAQRNNAYRDNTAEAQETSNSRDEEDVGSKHNSSSTVGKVNVSFSTNVDSTNRPAQNANSPEIKKSQFNQYQDLNSCSDEGSDDQENISSQFFEQSQQASGNVSQDHQQSATRPLTVSEAMRTSQFWLLYVMASLSVFQGYYTLNVYKAFGYTMPALADDAYLTKVGSAAALMGTMRFVWSASMDIKSSSFVSVYGVLLTIQIILGVSIEFAAKSRVTFAVWIALMVCTEGGHFTIMPNALRIIYGEGASAIYGVVFSFAGISNLLILCIVSSDFGQEYTKVYYLTAGLSLLAMQFLLFGFREEQLLVRAADNKILSDADYDESDEIEKETNQQNRDSFYRAQHRQEGTAS